MLPLHLAAGFGDSSALLATLLAANIAAAAQKNMEGKLALHYVAAKGTLGGEARASPPRPCILHAGSLFWADLGRFWADLGGSWADSGRICPDPVRLMRTGGQ